MNIHKTNGVNNRRGVREAHEGGPDTAFAPIVGPVGFCMRSSVVGDCPGRSGFVPSGRAVPFFRCAHGREGSHAHFHIRGTHYLGRSGEGFAFSHRHIRRSRNRRIP